MRRQGRARSGGGGGGDEVMAVALGDEGHEQLAGANRPGVERGSGQLAVGADQRSARRRGDVGRTEPHWPNGIGGVRGAADP